ncbi:UDP-glycosyltransferase 76F1-like [Chenopodium quinoa]|uniref:UDP-glycosyltransferase 76F1-like n=1 Tax=Chenopodium quinoa TaxID=63459 RepID=UPI000B77D729|nr:UDP-glycosyltransferase 76F1-like [Chenopodium quinoa]
MEGIMKQSKLGRRLLLFPTPFQGHQYPMLHLATLLHSKGFSITIIQTPYNPINPTYFPHLTFRSFYNSSLESYSKIPPSDPSTILSVMDDCSEPFQDCLSQILQETGAATDKEPIAALITDPVWKFAGSVAASFNLPRMVLRTGSMSSLLVFSSLPCLREKGYFPPQDHKLNEPLPELPPLKARDLPLEWLHNERLEALVQETKISQGVIGNTFEELEDYSIARVHQILSIPIFPIGPLHKHSPTYDTNYWAQDQTSIGWLNKQAPKSVLYVSFGSVAAMSKTEFLELAWGLLDSMVPFLWVVRPGLIQGSEANNDSLPEGYLEMVGERGHVVKWAPQLEVLSHPSVGGFWTHNGWNSTLESICEGVPMLCQPILSDQNMNARHVSDGWRIGLKLEKGLKREEIARSIRKLMLEEGEEMRNRITALQQKATLCVKEGGSSYISLERLTSYLLSF